MIIVETAIKGVFVVKSDKISDNRGAFMRMFCDKELAEVLGDRKIVQINYSKTSLVGTVRGLHFQNSPHAEMKLIRCLKGRVYDVAIDMRKDSPTYLKWHAEELSPDNANMMVIPEGCAHGFQVLEENSELIYCHTSHYYQPSEGGNLYNDPKIGIKWPLEVTLVSEKDLKYNLL